MNKRKYPYGVDMCPQLKIHVGDKQVANGVMAQTKMIEIYERTKQLLFKNAGITFETDEPAVVTNKVPCDLKPSKQLQLTFDGKLSKTESPKKVSTIYVLDNQQKCTFCSKTKNLDICGKCNDIYCNMCTFSLCNDDMNKICLTCYR
ncbi:apoptosis regulatory protein Siva-like [Adelges cooleyi]|uniref:apoptosis regulatory protein Siva-like n=1 Tax=Adelges cooleyi TaxID=133065 RepID=UPI00217FCC2F|nr:apoptosis regulatory protein Siva-like [Adelges cooleyi]